MCLLTKASLFTSLSLHLTGPHESFFPQPTTILLESTILCVNLSCFASCPLPCPIYLLRSASFTQTFSLTSVAAPTSSFDFNSFNVELLLLTQIRNPNRNFRHLIEIVLGMVPDSRKRRRNQRTVFCRSAAGTTLGLRGHFPARIIRKY